MSDLGRGDSARDSSERTAQRSYRTMLEYKIEEAMEELTRPRLGLWLSGLSAGLDLGFSVLLMAVVLTLVQDSLPPPVVRLLVANMYTIGFLFVIFGRSELFTEHTTRAVLPFFARRASLKHVLRLWGIVYGANLVGAVLSAFAITTLGIGLEVATAGAFLNIANLMLYHPWWVMLVSAILAGWLMGLLSWLVAAGRDTISQIFFVWLITLSIGIAELHHSIAGTVEVLAGMFATGEVPLSQVVRFLVLVTVGNAIGGVVFVALLKYSHAIRGAQAAPPPRP